jgi:hypothetical protein
VAGSFDVLRPPPEAGSISSRWFHQATLVTRGLSLPSLAARSCCGSFHVSFHAGRREAKPRLNVRATDARSVGEEGREGSAI